MKRTILLALAGTAIGLLALAGCKSDKCDTCGMRHEEAPCCGAPATGGEVRQAPMESRTETARPARPATRPAR